MKLDGNALVKKNFFYPFLIQLENFIDKTTFDFHAFNKISYTFYYSICYYNILSILS